MSLSLYANLYVNTHTSEVIFFSLGKFWSASNYR